MMKTATRSRHGGYASSGSVPTAWHFQFETGHGPRGWTPPINLYRIGNTLELCMDLAGMRREDIEVHIEASRLTIRGVREAPQPPCPGQEPVRILAMEIDHGPFHRTLVLSETVDLRSVTSEYRQGLLWIRMPLRHRH